MKKIFLIGLIFPLILILFGCSDSKEKNEMNVPSSTLPKVDYYVQYFRTDALSYDNTDTKTVWITSVKELDKYYEDNKEMYQFDSHSDMTKNIFKNSDSYNKSFFKNKALLFIIITEPSGSNSHSLSDLRRDSGKLKVTIERIVPEIGTQDMASWHLVVQVDSDIASLTPVISTKVK